MSWKCSAAPACQHGKAIAQRCSYLANPKRCSSGCRQFDGERYAIEVATDCCYCVQVPLVRREVRSQFLGSRKEKLRSAVTQNLARIHLLLRRDFKGRHTIGALALDAENFTTCRQDRGARAAAYDCFGQRRRRLNNVLAIVENEQKLLFSDAPSDGISRDGLGSKPKPKHPGHRGWHQVRIRQRRKVDEPPAIG